MAKVQRDTSKAPITRTRPVRLSLSVRMVDLSHLKPTTCSLRMLPSRCKKRTCCRSCGSWALRLRPLRDVGPLLTGLVGSPFQLPTRLRSSRRGRISFRTDLLLFVCAFLFLRFYRFTLGSTCCLSPCRRPFTNSSLLHDFPLIILVVAQPIIIMHFPLLHHIITISLQFISALHVLTLHSL